MVLGEVYLDIHQVVPLARFLAGTGVLRLELFFYISLVILLGVLFESLGLVMGIAFGILIGGMIFAPLIPQIMYVWLASIDKIAQVFVLGVQLPAMLASQLISTAVLSILFILAALWRFQRKEI